MALTQAGRDLTRLHRAAQVDIANEVERLARAAWPLLDLRDLDASVKRWADVVLPLVLDGRRRSGATAGTYLRAFALAEGYPLPPITTAPDVTEAVATSLRVTGPVTVKSLVATGQTTESASRTALSMVVGASRRHTLNGGRDVISTTTEADPNTAGWRRVGVGENCPFCRMLIGRGEVYSASTVTFAAHDSCNCQAEPAYGGGEPLSVEQYAASKRRQSDKDRERVRAWLRDNAV